MRGKIFQSFVCLLLLSLSASPVFACHRKYQKCHKPTPPPFEVYIRTSFKGQPDFAKYGAKRPGMVTGGAMFVQGQDKQLLPSKDKTISYVKENYASHAGLLVLNIERWGVKGSDAKVASNVAKYLTVSEWVKSAAPNAKVGWYGRPPMPGYNEFQSGTTSRSYLEMQAANDRLQKLANGVDAFFPGCYPNNANQNSWVNKCVGLISEAKRLGGPGKKVYPFINPRYHSQAAEGLGFSLVPEDYFLLQLQTIKKHADGVVIWYGPGLQWNEKEPWWQATLKFFGSK